MKYIEVVIELKNKFRLLSDGHKYKSYYTGFFDGYNLAKKKNENIKFLEKHYTVNEIAKELNVSKSYLDKKIQLYEIKPTCILGRQRYFNVDSYNIIIGNYYFKNEPIDYHEETYIFESKINNPNFV